MSYLSRSVLMSQNDEPQLYLSEFTAKSYMLHLKWLHSVTICNNNLNNQLIIPMELKIPKEYFQGLTKDFLTPSSHWRFPWYLNELISSSSLPFPPDNFRTTHYTAYLSHLSILSLLINPSRLTHHASRLLIPLKY